MQHFVVGFFLLFTVWIARIVSKKTHELIYSRVQLYLFVLTEHTQPSNIHIGIWYINILYSIQRKCWSRLSLKTIAIVLVRFRNVIRFMTPNRF